MTLAPSGQLEEVRRILIIHNPTAGRRRKKRVAELAGLLRAAGLVVTIAETRSAGDAEQIASCAAFGAEPPDVVVAAGGDGTVNEVANGLLGGTTPLAVLPLGTVNVLARELDLGSSVRQIARAIAAGRVAHVWPGMANGRAFLLMAGIGFDAEVVAAVSPRLKRRLGRLAYVAMAMRLWWRWPARHARVAVNGVSHDAASAIVARCRLYGGSFVSAAAARLDKPQLHVVLLERDGRLAALGYAFALVTGQLHRWPGVSHLQATSSELVDGSLFQIDGDTLRAEGLRLSIAGSPLQMICAQA